MKIADRRWVQLWMGTHPKNPAKVWGKGMPLSSHLAQHPELLGDATKFPPPFPIDPKDTSGGEGHVPFLFKILTCKQGTYSSSECKDGS